MSEDDLADLERRRWTPLAFLALTVAIGLLAAFLVLRDSGSPSHGVSPTAASSTSPPTLGLPWVDSSIGFGAVKPSRAYNGGDPTGDFQDITWDRWGDAIATGSGAGCYVGEGIVADCRSEPIKLVAYDLGECDGHTAYRRLAVYFPTEGGDFNPATNGEAFWDLCTWDADEISPSSSEQVARHTRSTRHCSRALSHGTRGRGEVAGTHSAAKPSASSGTTSSPTAAPHSTVAPTITTGK